MKQPTTYIVKNDQYLPYYLHSSSMYIINIMHLAFSVPYEDIKMHLQM